MSELNYSPGVTSARFDQTARATTIARSWDGLSLQASQYPLDPASAEWPAPGSGRCPLDDVTTGQPGTNWLIQILHRQPCHGDRKWQNQENPDQHHCRAWMSGVSEVRKDIDERDVGDVEGIGEPTAEFAKPHHARARFRVRSAKNDEGKQQEHARHIVETVERETAGIGELWHLEDNHKRNRKNQKPNLGPANARLNAIQPEPHDEGNRQSQRCHPDLGQSPASVQRTLRIRDPDKQQPRYSEDDPQGDGPQPAKNQSVRDVS